MSGEVQAASDPIVQVAEPEEDEATAMVSGSRFVGFQGGLLTARTGVTLSGNFALVRPFFFTRAFQMSLAAQALTTAADGLFGPKAVARTILGMPKDKYSALDVLLAAATSRIRLLALVATTDSFEALKQKLDTACQRDEQTIVQQRLNAQIAQLLVLAGVPLTTPATNAPCPAFDQLLMNVEPVKQYLDSLKNELPTFHAKALERLAAIRASPAQTLRALVDGIDLDTRNEVMDVLAQVTQDYANSPQAAQRFKPLKTAAILVAALLLLILLLLLWRWTRK